ncbi:hypothetical protein LTR84_003205 [Exophiala bonariae]|uniref:Kelch repeat protein n=1 Tax=Exophiala bonariae TaxID=1690606 RepID=A0AAV9N926_9EURO|nr:hypothetical protein LTR84_003205 [Exophiala bonariae]
MKTTVRVSLQALLLVISLVAADYNSAEICSWDRPRVGLIRTDIYLEGGTLALPKDGNCKSPSTAEPLTGLLFKLDLSAPFDISNGNTPAIFHSIAEGTMSNFFFDGALFYDYDELYAWGGTPHTIGDTTWPFTLSYPLYEATDGSNNSLTPITNYAPEDRNFRPRTNGAGISVPSEDLGFYFGGMYNDNGAVFTQTNPPTNRSTQLIVVSTVNQGRASWQEHIPDPNGIIPPWRADAGLVWLPTSAQGILVVIGGTTTPTDIGGDASKGNATTSHDFLKQFSIYDIFTQKWAIQSLDSNSGFPNTALAQFCTAVASNENGTEHDIFVYGGWDGNSSLPNSDVWVLSVPSFTWSKADSGKRAGVARQGHTCTSPYPDSMLVVGGTAEYGLPFDINQAVDVYDLNELQWTGTYDPYPEKHQQYQRNSLIQDVVSKRPVADSIDPLVAGWFNQTYQMDKIKTYPYNVSRPTTAGNPPPPANSTLPVLPTEGHHKNRDWVVPVAAAVPSASVVLIIGLAILLWRRKRRLESEDVNSNAQNRPKSRIVPWIWATHQSHKEVGSDTMTEVEQAPPKSPEPLSPGLQELADTQKRGYFASVLSNDSSHHRWSSTTPARSPLNYDIHQEVEVPDNPVHEIEGEQRPLPTDQVNYDIRNQPMYPPTIVSGGNHAFSTTGSQSSPEDWQHSGPLGGSLAPAPTSPRGIAIYPEGEYAHPDGLGPLDVSPLVDRPNQRPRHRRHNSSVSSGMSLPSPGEQSPQSMPRTTRSLSGDHNVTTTPSVQDDDIQRANQTY